MLSLAELKVAKRNQDSEREPPSLGYAETARVNVIPIDLGGSRATDHVVRGSVEETLNAPLDAEADRHAQHYERSNGRREICAGHYERKLQTKAGEVG